MVKTIVTHMNPDLDAICGVWLFKKFDNSFKDAELEFVPAGETYNNQKVDSDESVVHIDTGLGRFDHHQLEGSTCASELVFNYLKSKYRDLEKDKALLQLIKVVCQIDHFQEALWPEATDSRYAFLLSELLDGLKIGGKVDDAGLIEFGIKCLDGVYAKLRLINKAETELAEGLEFKTKWGQAIGCLTSTNEVLKLGQKKGFVLVVQKDPLTEHLRIKARPDSQVDLTGVKEKLSQLDPQATWFLHISKKMLLNGTTKSDKMKPSSLSIKKVVEVIKSEK